MMRKWQTAAAALLLLLALCGCKTAAEQEWILDLPKPNPVLEAQPEVVTYPMDTDETIRVLLPGEEGAFPLLERAEEYTGIHTEYEFVPFQELTSTLLTRMKSGDTPDLFYGYSMMGLTDFLDYGDEVATDLTDAISRCAPNYLAAIRGSDALSHTAFDGEYGEMFSFYQIQRGEGLQDYGPVIRADWLEELGMETPVTYEDYHDVLTAFRDVYGCEQAFGIQPTCAMRGNYLAAGYGVTSYVSGNDLASVGFYVADGKVKYGPAEEGYWDYVAMLRQWYEEKLFTSDFITWSDLSAYEREVSLGEMGLLYTTATRVQGLAKTLDGGRLEPIPDAVQTPGDALHLAERTSKETGPATLIVPNTSEKVDLAVRWCDFWYGDEGVRLVNYGTAEPIAPEEIDPANRCQMLPGIYDLDLNRVWTDEQLLSISNVWSRNRDSAWCIPAETALSEADYNRLALIAQGLTTAVTVWTSKLIVGDESMENRDAYLAELDKCGLPKALACLEAYLFGVMPEPAAP